MRSRNIILIMIFMIAFAIGKMNTNKNFGALGVAIFAILPIFLVWILLRYKFPTKKQHKLTMCGFASFGLSFYLVIISQLLGNKYPNTLNKYHLIFGWGIVAFLALGVVLLTINRILFYEDKNDLL